MGSTMLHNKWAEMNARRESEREAQANALAAVEQFNQRMAARKPIWSWPIIGAALLSKHHWLVCTCDACTTIIELDLRMKPRDSATSLRVALNNVRCPRCNGHGRTRLVKLAKYPGDY